MKKMYYFSKSISNSKLLIIPIYQEIQLIMLTKSLIKSIFFNIFKEIL